MTATIVGRMGTRMGTEAESEEGAVVEELGDGLVLRRGAAADAEALAAFNAQVHGAPGPPDARIGAWARDLCARPHPTFRPPDFTIVEDTRRQRIVSSLNLISQTWAYGGVPFGVGRIELVGTWHWGASTTTARLVGEDLVLGEPGTARGSRFRRTGQDTWVGLDSYHTGEPLRVVRRADGTVSHLDLASFRFTRTPYDPTADVPGGVDDLGWH